MAGNWTDIGTLSEGKKAATYRSIGFESELCGDVYVCSVSFKFTR